MSAYLTLAEATERVPVSITTLRRAIKSGALTGFKRAGKLLIRREDLDAWVEAGRVKAEPMPCPQRETSSFLNTIRQDRQDAA